MHWTWPFTLKIPEGKPMPYQAWLWWHYCCLLPKGETT